MAISSATELKILVKTAGEQNLNRLSRQLEGVGKNTVSADFKFDKFSRSLKRQEQQATKNISNLRTFAGAWRELANSVDYTSAQFREANREAQRLERQLAKTQQRKVGVAGLAKGAGAVAAAGIFGGPEGAIGALAGLPFGPAGAAVGGAIGAQVGAVRQQLGGTATYAAEIAKQRLALKLVTKEAGEYQRALSFVDQTSRKFAIPQEIITRQFTKLTASVKGAGGSVADAEKAFLGVAAGIRGTGGSLQDLDSALTATSQVFSKGKVSAEELRQQIGERLPGAFTLFAESMGMTPQELDKALEDGKVSLQDFQKFAEKLFNEYGEAAKVIASGPEAAGDRLQTALSRLSESVGNLLRPIGAAFQTEFAKIVIAIDKAAKSLADFLGLGKGRAGEIAKLQRDLAATDERLRAFAQLRVKRGGTLGPVEYAQEQRLSQRRIEMAARLSGLQAAEKAAADIKVDEPKGLPGFDTGGGAKEKQTTQKIKTTSNELLGLIKQRNDALLVNENFQAAILSDSIEQLRITEALTNGQIDLNTAQAMRSEQEVRFRNALLKLRKQDKQEMSDAVDNQKKLNKELTEGQKLGQSIVTTFAQGMGDALMNLFERAKSFREILSDLLRSTAKLLLNFGLQAATKGLFPGLFPQASGGVMTSKGPMPLRSYARGGIANSPQLAMFGEGSTPEAYVPLPDGRSIPVKMKGGGEGSKVIVNVDASGSGVQGNEPNAAALGRAIGAAVQAELVKQKRPGGLLA